ncbi:MAG: hypothetical protein ACNI27_07405 [Desulfovibrio sp.]
MISHSFRSFNAGLFSPDLYGRTEIEPYKRALAESENVYPIIQGPIVNRAGTRYVVSVKDHAKPVRLIDFEYSTEQTYMLEFGEKYVRFCKHDGQLKLDDKIYELVTPYTTEELNGLQYAQSADQLFIVHPDHEPHVLSRTESGTWTMEPIEFKDGPYLDENVDEHAKLYSNYLEGDEVIITASGTLTEKGVEAAFEPFSENSVGMCIRLKHDEINTDNKVVWGWARVTEFISKTSVKAKVGSKFGATSWTDKWRLGAWGKDNGYPCCVHIFEQSWIYGGTKKEPQTWWRTVGGSYEEFSPTEPDGTVKDDSGISATLGSNKVHYIQWIASAKSLMLGTRGAEIRIATPMDEPLKPTNSSPKFDNESGCAAVQPVRAGSTLIAVQRHAKEVFGLRFSFEANGLEFEDLTQFANHVCDEGLSMICYQRNPHSIIWGLRKDGRLVGLTFDRKEGVCAWHVHRMGGDGFIESIATIAGDGRDELWLVVRRTINSTTKRYIEKLNDEYERGQDQAKATFVDCSLTYEGEPVTVISALDHLEGETVSILADGALHPPVKVTGGAITLRNPASIVQVGLPYRAYFAPLGMDMDTERGSTVDKRKRVVRLAVDMEDTMGIKIGPTLDQLDTIQFRSTAVPMGKATPLFTGAKEMAFGGSYSKEPRVYVVQDAPLPMKIRSLILQMQISAR